MSERWPCYPLIINCGTANTNSNLAWSNYYGCSPDTSTREVSLLGRYLKSQDSHNLSSDLTISKLLYMSIVVLILPATNPVWGLNLLPISDNVSSFGKCNSTYSNNICCQYSNNICCQHMLPIQVDPWCHRLHVYLRTVSHEVLNPPFSDFWHDIYHFTIHCPPFRNKRKKYSHQLL